MADTLYGADLGSVATDAAGNVKDGQSFTVYTDSQGTNQLTGTKDCASNFTVGAGNGGVVTASPLGRIVFYAPNTTDTLWLKNGTNFWAVNPTSPMNALQGSLNTLQQQTLAATSALDARVASLEAASAHPVATYESWQEWRGRMSTAKTCSSGYYTSLNFSAAVTTPSLFGVNFNTDSLSVNLAGWYRISMRAAFNANATGFRYGLILQNAGANSLNSANPPSAILAAETYPAVNGATSTVTASEDVYLTPADGILFVVFQNSGGTLDVNNARHLTSATIAYLGTS